MTSFPELFKNMMFVGLFVLSMFGFIFIFQAENSVTEQISDDKLINDTFNTLEEDLKGLRDESQSQRELFETENPTLGFGSFLLFSIISSGKVFGSMIVGTFNTLILLPVVVFGLDPAILGVIGTLFVVSIIFGLWFVYKLGG